MRFCIRRLHASRRRFRSDRAFTLVEILVAMVVTLIMLGIVVTIFGMIGQNVSYSRSTMEMTDRLRATKQRLQLDLAGITVPMLPPQNPDSGLGYLEITEGPVGRVPAYTVNVPDENGTNGPDTTVGDNDDFFMCTTQSSSEPFVGRHQGTTVQSQVAEVIWFLRGTTLYRRQLLVKPDFNRTGLMPTAAVQYATGSSYYATSDISAHADGKGTAGEANLGPLPMASDPLRLVANSLSDLTKRENRYAHVPVMGTAANQPLYGWPFDARKFGWVPLGSNTATTARLGLPTLQECSDPLWPLPIGISAGSNTRFFPVIGLSTASGNEEFDAWEAPTPWLQTDALTGQLNATGGYGNGTRVGEDVILTNVLSFDIRVWDPTAPIITDPNGNIFAPGDPSPGYGVPTVSGGRAGGYANGLIEVAKGTSGWGVVSRGAYVDLNYMYYVINEASLTAVQLATITSHFSGAPDIRSGMSFTAGMTINGSYTVPNALVPAVYDTWSTRYERDGLDQNANGLADEGTNGIDDLGIGGAASVGLIDDDLEQETAPPYASPLRGIQIKIRCFDPDSKQIREVTIVQEFLPE